MTSLTCPTHFRYSGPPIALLSKRFPTPVHLWRSSSPAKGPYGASHPRTANWQSELLHIRTSMNASYRQPTRSPPDTTELYLNRSRMRTPLSIHAFWGTCRREAMVFVEHLVICGDDHVRVPFECDRGRHHGIGVGHVSQWVTPRHPVIEYPIAM